MERMYIESPDVGMKTSGFEVVGTWINGNVTLRFEGTTFEVDMSRAEVEQTIEVLTGALIEARNTEAYGRLFEVMDEGAEYE